MTVIVPEKGPGLQAAIEAAGHWLVQIDGVWQSSNDAAVQAIIDAYDPAEIKRPDMVLTDIQFAQVLLVAGILTEAEALGWVSAGVIPAIATAAIATLPAEQQPFARIRFAGARTIARLDPFIALLQGIAGLTDAQLDAMFEQGAAL